MATLTESLKLKSLAVLNMKHNRNPFKSLDHLKNSIPHAPEQNKTAFSLNQRLHLSSLSPWGKACDRWTII